ALRQRPAQRPCPLRPREVRNLRALSARRSYVGPANDNGLGKLTLIEPNGASTLAVANATASQVGDEGQRLAHQYRCSVSRLEIQIEYWIWLDFQTTGAKRAHGSAHVQGGRHEQPPLT